jgi:hypothetical protein
MHFEWDEDKRQSTEGPGSMLRLPVEESTGF